MKERKKEALEKLSKLTLIEKNLDTFYWKIVELTLLLQNDYANSVPESELSNSSLSRLQKHRGFRYDLTYDMVIRSIIENFYELKQDSPELKFYAEALCIICAHESETASRSRILNSMYKNTMLTGSVIILLRNFGITVTDDITGRRFEEVKTRLANKNVCYFIPLIDKSSIVNSKHDNNQVAIPDFSNAQSKYNIIMHHVYKVTKYIKFFEAISAILPTPAFTKQINLLNNLINELYVRKQDFEEISKSITNHVDLEPDIMIGEKNWKMLGKSLKI